MEVKYGLSCYFTVVLYDIEAVTSQCFCHGCSHLLCQNHCFRSHLFRDLIQVCVVMFRKDQCMSFCCRTKIQDHTKIIILIQCSGRNISTGNFTENTITHFYSPLRFVLFFLTMIHALSENFQSSCVLFYCPGQSTLPFTPRAHSHASRDITADNNWLIPQHASFHRGSGVR